MKAKPVLGAFLVVLLTACGAGESDDTGGYGPSESYSGLSGSSDDIRSATSTEGADSDTMPTPSPDDAPGSQPQPGTLTAGDYDDQLNSHLYADYLSDVFQNIGSVDLELPYVDVLKRIAVHISDSEGQPYPGARISVRLEQTTLLELITPATGTVYLYAVYDELPAVFDIRVTDRSGDVVQTQPVTLADLVDDEAQDPAEINIALPALAQAASQLDLALVIDTTGSMGDELNYLKTELTSILENVSANYPQLAINVALILYRDIGDAYVVRDFEFNSSIADIQVTLNEQGYDGGGDYPEAMDQALVSAIQLQWREQSSKILLLVADAPPHDNKIDETWQVAETARSEQIHIVPVAASGVGQLAEFVMRAMAAFTHSRYLFLTDDSGVGNSHKEPSVDCYIVTRLDSLIARVIASLVSGARVEPAQEEIIRSVGNYNQGVCELDEEQE